MDSDFWINKWQNNQIGFHQDDYHPSIKSFFKVLEIKENDTVFVPMCGKSKDILCLNALGHPVIANELSAIAVNDFFKENSIEFTRKDEKNFQYFTSKNIEILCGDYFQLKPMQFNDVTAVYDRAVLIALPEKMRKQYVEHLFQIMPEKFSILLVTLEYAQEKISGPPFSVGEDEVNTLYAGCKITCLKRKNEIDQNRRFQEAGVPFLNEVIYQIET